MGSSELDASERERGTNEMATVAGEEGVGPDTRLEFENKTLKDEIDALKKENEQLRRELARERATAGEEGTSGGKRKRTEPIDRSIEKALPRLPTEVWAEVAAKLEKDDVMAFASTSKQLREAQQQSGRNLVTGLTGRRSMRMGMYRNLTVPSLPETGALGGAADSA